MERYRIISLVDITRSNATRLETNKLKIGQQSNFNSLIQSVGLRSNICWDFDPCFKNGSLPAPLDGKANHWIWEFTVEQDMVYFKDGDYTAHLIDDLNGVPVVILLNETIDIHPAVFCTKGKQCNIWIHKVDEKQNM